MSGFQDAAALWLAYLANPVHFGVLVAQLQCLYCPLAALCGMTEGFGPWVAELAQLQSETSRRPGGIFRDMDYMWCYITNYYGNTWVFGRAEGAESRGGSPTATCPGRAGRATPAEATRPRALPLRVSRAGTSTLGTLPSGNSAVCTSQLRRMLWYQLSPPPKPVRA